MYAPVVTRFLTYDVKLDVQSAEYCERNIYGSRKNACTKTGQAEVAAGVGPVRRNRQLAPDTMLSQSENTTTQTAGSSQQTG